MERKRVGIVIFNNVEVLDFCGPFEVFSTTRLNETAREVEPSPFEVLLVAEKPEPVLTVGGMRVVPQCTFDDCPHLDILVVPGGRGAREEQLDNPIILDWIRTRAQKVETLTSVCTGAMLLGKAGLLAGLHATTHWRALDRMRDTFPDVTVEYHKHFVHQGHVYTSAGISAGIDMSLKVVEEYFGETVARATAENMEYPYPETDERRIKREPPTKRCS
ncbi:MAG: DJ-1/PfpI family protein [Terriglobia bacterium]